MALAAVVRGIAGALDETFPARDLLKLKLDDGSVYACFKAQDDGERATVTIVYSDPDSYPSSSALVMCDGNPAAAEKLEGLSERFQDRAPLTLVLSKVQGVQMAQHGHAPAPVWRQIQMAAVAGVAV